MRFYAIKNLRSSGQFFSAPLNIWSIYALIGPSTSLVTLIYSSIYIKSSTTSSIIRGRFISLNMCICFIMLK